jgi:outer membrane protein assembly factor BamB
MVRLTISAIAALSLSLPAFAEDWPGWRGPRHDGHSSEKNLPTQWSSTENIAWKTPLSGVGHSSPIVVAGRVFVTSCSLKEQSRILTCLDRKTGNVLWQKDVIHSPLEPKHGLNSYSSATPASDGKYVFVSFLRIRPKTESDDYPRKPREAGYLAEKKSLGNVVSEMVVACYDFAGNQVWIKSPGQFYSRHGYCTTPILYKDSVILNGDQDAEAFIVALDKTTGEEKWRIDRGNRIRSYCAPLIVDAAGKKQLVVSGAKTVNAYNPDDGKLLWTIDGPTAQFVASPVFDGELLFITAGFPTYHNMAIRPDGAGNVTKTHIAWHEANTAARKAAYVPSPIVFDRWLYVISDEGYLNCFDAKSGKRLWIEKLGQHHSASPVLADGRLYLPADDGTTYVVKAGGKFEVLAENPIGDQCFSSLAISNGQIFLRGNRALYCIGKK